MTRAGSERAATAQLHEAISALDDATQRLSALRNQLWRELGAVDAALQEALGALHGARRVLD